LAFDQILKSHKAIEVIYKNLNNCISVLQVQKTNKEVNWTN